MDLIEALRRKASGEFMGMTAQLVDSAVPKTRSFWRKRCGLSDEIAGDPRPLLEVLSDEGDA